MFADSTSLFGAAERDRQRICRALMVLIDERGYAETTLERVK